MIERIECWEVEPKAENSNKFMYIFPKDDFLNTSRYPFDTNVAFSTMKDEHGNFYRPLDKILKFLNRKKEDGFMICREHKHFIFGSSEVRAFIPTAIYELLDEKSKVPTTGFPLYIIVSA